MNETFIQLAYIASSVLFILGLRSLTRPDQARRGMRLAALGMLVAIVATLAHQQIVDYRWIAGGLVVGVIAGYPLGMWVPMTAMPQRIAMALSLGALAATLVGVAEYYTRIHEATGLGRGTAIALGFEVMLGALTVTGASVAFLKLQELITGRPVTYRGQNVVTGILVVVLLSLFGMLIARPDNTFAFYGLIAVAAIFGVQLVMPIGGADMPVVVALLNSYAGLAAAATGFALNNNILIICGALDGASGFILSLLMSKAMNRSFRNIIFGAFGSGPTALAVDATGDRTVRSLSVEDAAIQLAYAQLVVVVPGYGMAVAQAQHQVRELAELIERNGGEVKYAVHPVAGRMPGHMNVLLAEANIAYDRMYDMEEINADFERVDVVLVIGANDVVNPAARSDPSSPIFGMPILDADKAKSVIVMKRGMAAGFAGIENALFYAPRTSMLFGDAKATLTKLIGEIKAM
ncbi:MAG: NAD(P)(+) transhydrogenase (Re/Si-specific) subunit beta [Gemmatimonadaceae bacterium]|nr:NAD(P)(+) transhydrogenase (Re/Si-specific) subunit beta [Gemmatimonadaceae bacterium]